MALPKWLSQLAGRSSAAASPPPLEMWETREGHLIISALTLFICLSLATLWLHSRRRRQPRARRPPLAPGWLPLLGHALAYRSDPGGFLAKTSASLGPVFRLNLAGKRLVVIGDSDAAVMQVASAAECRLSARDAVSAVGFGETLGDLNVMIGTDIHKRWIKEAYGSGKLADEVVPLVDALRRGLLLAVRTLSGGMMGHLALPDLFKTVRFAGALAEVTAIAL